MYLLQVKTEMNSRDRREKITFPEINEIFGGKETEQDYLKKIFLYLYKNPGNTGSGVRFITFP